MTVVTPLTPHGSTELGWHPRHNFSEGLKATVAWYLDNTAWCQQVGDNAGYKGERLGSNNSALDQKAFPQKATANIIQNTDCTHVKFNNSVALRG